MKTDLKSLVTAKLNQVQQVINLARANLSKEQRQPCLNRFPFPKEKNWWEKVWKWCKTMVAGAHRNVKLIWFLIFYWSTQPKKRLVKRELRSWKWSSSIKAPTIFSHACFGLFSEWFLPICFCLWRLAVVWLEQISQLPRIILLQTSNYPAPSRVDLKRNTVFFHYPLGSYVCGKVSPSAPQLHDQKDSGKAISPSMMLVI